MSHDGDSGGLEKGSMPSDDRRSGLSRPLRRLGSGRRQPDHWSSPHERARVRAAERLEAALPTAEATWLERHLADCDSCRRVADAYAADRLALRHLRDRAPEPPRELWAKTAARIEQESGSRVPAVGGTGAARPATRQRQLALPALGALSGVAVVVFVMVATAISGGFFGQTLPNQANSSPPVAEVTASAPPPSLAVGAGSVKWLGLEGDGAFAYNVAKIDVVCRHDNAPECPPFEDGDAKRVTLTATPKYVYQSPVDFQAVVVGTDAKGADAVLVVALPTPDPTPLVEPSVSASPVVEASADASATPGASASVAVSVSQTPIGDPPSLDPSETPTDHLSSEGPATSETASLEPGTTSAVAILKDVTIVGRSAAYSPDGSWFAFSARPVDGSTGPDIYVWHVGDPEARPLTNDHASVFASWVGGHIVGSRVSSVGTESPTESAEPGSSPEVPPSDDPTPSIEPTASLPAAATVDVEHVPEAFLIDPWTGAELGLLATEWRPAVDPTRVAVVAWQGTVGVAGDGLTTQPATGNLVVHPFRGQLEAETPVVEAPPSVSEVPSLSPSQSPSVSVEASPSQSASASAEASADVTGPLALDFPPQVVAEGPILDFDARWDDTGTWLAVWLADPLDPEIGRLSLFHFDPTTGMLDRPVGAPRDVAALPGFSIGYGRLVWASPPGQGGEGSRIQIAAWNGAEVGAIESIPVEGAIVVQ